MSLVRGVSALLLSALISSSLFAQKPYPPRLRWWGEGRFGMFIHWGPVSLKEAEISWSRANTNPKCPNNGPIPAAEYDNLYKRFDPVKFNADEWVRIAKSAGMKYMVLTAKHCDGFLLWNSKVSDYNIMHTPFHRDVCGELAAAAHRAGMKIGWYFSPMDWKDPDCRNANNTAFVKRMQGEIRELLTQYGRIDLLWFDYDGGTVPWDQEGTYALVKKLQPGIIIDNRLDLGPNTNAGDPRTVGPNADYFTPEQWIGGYNDQKPWESCMTISRIGQWSWAGKKDGVKPLDSLIEMLVKCAGGDGNVLLDVGPTPEGVIAPEQVERLRQIGQWMRTAGESIYRTRGGPYRPGEYGSSTRSGKQIYLHIRNWEEDPLRLPPLPSAIVKARVLTGGSVRVKADKRGIQLFIPAKDRKPMDTIVALTLDRSAIGMPDLVVPASASLTFGAKATASNVYHASAEYGPDKAVDGRLDTRWATDDATRSAWLEVDFGKPKAFRRAWIDQAYAELHRVRKYRIEYWTGTGWKPCYQGADMPARVNVRFAPVTAQRVRLNVTESTNGPTINEFRLFEN
ncbi:MAG: alpha-L-fucosidase [Fimbriimonas sp.]|nr:alpha-L-fucosidase [Fimbriimonas sp.]